MSTPIEWLNEFQVNTGTADVAGISDPQVIGLAGGNYLVAWTEPGTTGAGTSAGNDVIGKIFDAAGNLVRDSFQLNTGRTAHDEDDFDIAATNDGGFMMVYIDDDTTFTNQENVIWERFNAAGNQTDFLSVASNNVAGDILSNPKIVVNNNDNSSYVIFQDNVSGSDPEVRGVRLDAAGTIVTAEFDAAVNTGGFSRDAEAAININGELVTAYEEDDSGFTGIELRVMNTSGVVQHGVNVVIGSSTLTASDPHVATLTNGNIAVTWTESSTVYYAVYDINLGLVKAKAPVGPIVTQNTNEPSIAALPDGGFVIIYDNDTTNTLQARRYNDDGTNDATDTFFTVRAGTNETVPNVAALADGRMLFSWEESDNVFSSIWDTRGNNIDAADYEGLPLNFVETDITTTNVINSSLEGDSDGDTLLGQDGNDDISGNGGNDIIFGGAGNDTLNGDNGNDTLNGGLGDDLFIGGAGTDSFNGGSGTDTIDYSGNTADGSVDFITGTAQFGAITEGFTSIEGVITGSGNDKVFTTFGVQTVDTGDGNDLVTTRDGEFIDNLDGGAGRDTLDLSAAVGASEAVDIDLGAGSWTGLGGTRTIAGFEEIIGTQEDDTIDGGSLARVIDGQGGDDFLDIGGTASFENVTVSGGSGDDTIMANNSAFETLDGGSGTDLIDTTKFSGAYNINLTTGVTNFGSESFINFEDVITGDGNDSILGTSGANNITTRNGNDLVSALFGADIVSTGNGNDTIYGGGDNDTLMGQGGNDFIRGDAGNDSILGGAGSDTLNGSDGNDRLFGEGSADNINGDAGNDFITGGSGNDSITGGDGIDNIQGQGNNDVISGGNGNDIIRGQAGLDNIGGDAGNDFIDGGGAADTVDGGDGDDTVDGGTERDLVTGGSGNDSLIGGGGNDTVQGGSGDDTMEGGTGNDTMEGGTGSDLMTGGGGVDTLDGGAGADTVNGGIGNDLLLVAAGEGGDILFGGTGSDVFDFESGFVAVKIEDFGTTDLVDLQDVTTVSSFGDLSIFYSGGGTSANVDLGGGDELIFNNLTALLNAGDFIF